MIDPPVRVLNLLHDPEAGRCGAVWPGRWADVMREPELSGAEQGRRRLPVGAEVMAGGGVHFRVWAPRHESVLVVLEGGPGPEGRPEPRGSAVAMAAEGQGYFEVHVPSAASGTLYRYQLGRARCADPASRFQPEGPHGPSQVVDPGCFAWTDQDWHGVGLEGQVLYEAHIGTLTRAGTWDAAAEVLPALAELGVTVLELMPVAEFPGRWGWSYDGVDLFAPAHAYGPPDAMRRFVDRAHALGLGVILDVCYNHLGPVGNVLREFAPAYFSDRYASEWGEALNFDGEGSGPVRELVLANAGYWIAEFHLDGLRIDATQDVHDGSPEHILAALARRVRQAARGRRTLLIGENEVQDVTLIQPIERGGSGFDALWNEDFHHAAVVAATGWNEAYYSDYRGTPQELVSAARYGFLYQGQRNTRQGKRRGTPTFGITPAAFVNYLQNHDQVANSPLGARLHRLTSPGRYRALTALLLLAPGTPMLFQGQEFAASSPFFFFGDHTPEIAARMDQGRRAFLEQFPSLSTPEMQARLPGSADPETFVRSKLDPAERAGHAEVFALHRDLLRLRRDDRVFRAQGGGGLDGAVLGAEAFVLRSFGGSGDDRLLVVNLGRDLHLDPAPVPLLAPPAGAAWEVLWSSEDPRFGGSGTPPLDTVDNWRIPGHAAVVLAPRALGPNPHG
jgi:maltooligosyltrehalose trehalohydrolase